MFHLMEVRVIEEAFDKTALRLIFVPGALNCS
jgi:hypothetical protein